MALDLTSFAAGLKTLYPAGMIEKLTYQNNPLLALMPKSEDFYGDSKKCPLIYGNSQNRSNTFSNANAQTSTALMKAFLLTRGRNYSIASLDNETAEASKSNEGAFLEASKLVIDAALESLAQSNAIQMYRSGSGSIGKVKAASSPAGTFTLQEINDITNFEVGMKLNASTADGGGSLKADKPLITAIDRITGIVTVNSTVAGTWAADDYIFCDGDYDAAIKGLDAWLPYDNRSARLAASFFGVTRTADASRLGGIIYNGSGSNMEEAIIDGLNLGYREGGEFDYMFLNPLDVSVLVKLLGSKVQRVQVSAAINENGKQVAAVGFNGIELYYAGGNVKVIGDRSCPKGRGFGLTMKTWELASLGKAVNLFEGDGLKWIRSTSADSLDLRCYSYLQVGCKAPGRNIQINFV